MASEEGLLEGRRSAGSWRMGADGRHQFSGSCQAELGARLGGVCCLHSLTRSARSFAKEGSLTPSLEGSRGAPAARGSGFES